MKTKTALVTEEMHEELKKENAETRVPIVYLLEKAWEVYKKSKEIRNAKQKKRLV